MFSRRRCNDAIPKVREVTESGQASLRFSAHPAFLYELYTMDVLKSAEIKIITMQIKWEGLSLYWKASLIIAEI